MSEIIQWLSQNPLITYILVASISISLIIIILLFVLAFAQGREVAFWPPKIGSKSVEIKQHEKSLVSVVSEERSPEKPPVLSQKNATNETVRAFTSRELSYDDQAQCIKELQPQVIYVVDSFPSWPPTLFEHPRWKLFEGMLEKGAILYRVVRISNIEQWEATKKMLQRWKNYNFYLGIMLTDPKDVPVVRCVIYDRKIVYFGQMFIGDIQKGSIKIAEPDSVTLFYDYFQFLWNQAKILKGERGIDQNALSEINETVHKQPNLLVYRNRPDSYCSMQGALDNSKESVDIVSYVNLSSTDDLRNQFYSSLHRAVKERHVSHQRIIWNLDQILWAEKVLDQGWDELPEFSVKFYLVPFPSKVPLTTFDLIDQETILLGQGWLTEGHIAIKDKEAGQYFRSYFATLWEQSEWIKKRGQPADRARLKALAEELSRGT